MGGGEKAGEVSSVKWPRPAETLRPAGPLGIMRTARPKEVADVPLLDCIFLIGISPFSRETAAVMHANLH